MEESGEKGIWLGRMAPNAPEAAILSTCNRTELYCATDDLAAREAAIRWLSKYHGIPVDELAPHVYALPQSEAVRHAFRVASGLDSMVLGEAQILGKQLLRCGTSVAANYRATCRSRSKAEFISRLGIVAEEADESVLWLELLEEAGILKHERLAEIMKEAKELVAIFSTSLKTAKGNK